MTIHSSRIALVDTLSSAFDQSAADGVIGLAFGACPNFRPEANGFVETLLSQDELPSSAKLFTARFSPSNNSDQDKPFLTFGGIDENTEEKSIHYTPIDKQHGFWNIESSTATVGGKSIDRPQNRAVIDTDAALTLLEDTVCQTIYDAIPGAFYDSESQGFLFPLDADHDKLPTIELDIGKKLFRIPKKSLGFAEAKPGYVYGGVQSRGSLGHDVLGLSFLEGICAVGLVGSD